ncbi:MAG TPA: GTPase HflX [Gammaproteobacteria bacterium]|nr:GTPase HflX [Gammaproteobacteria bacterium]
MFERPEGGERAVLVHLEFPDDKQREALAEFRELVEASGAVPVSVVTGSRRVPDPKYFIGSGKAEQIRQLVAHDGKVDLVLFNHALSPAQERNLERLFNCRVLDRTGLILDIFAQRARSHEGKLQVELAQLRHISTRLVRGWTHLERQKGGIGLRGPGETQLETDRRLLGERIKHLRRRLEKVRHQREQGRRSRRRAEVATVSLVGYTNAGKSSLFNRLTRSEVYAADQLFATLDPTLRQLELGSGCSAVLADTVGFIRHLPHDLVAAFRSTLQESRDAQLLLHVVDASDPLRHEKIEQVNLVLKEIGAEQVPQIEVYNKIDLLDNVTPRVERDQRGLVRRVWLSALGGEGLDLVRGAVEERLAGERRRYRLRIPPSQGRLRALLYEWGAVIEEQEDSSGGWVLVAQVDGRQKGLLQRVDGFGRFEPLFHDATVARGTGDGRESPGL